jgi:hypothetical protein
MFWFLLILIISGLLYSAFHLMNYHAVLEDARSRIGELEMTVQKFAKAVEQERRKGRDIAEMLSLSKGTESDLKNEITLTVARVQEEQKKESELEMDMYKQEFKRNKQRKY